MSPLRGFCVDFQLGLWISANSVGNINTAEVATKEQKAFNFASWQKKSSTVDPGSYLDYLYMFVYAFIITITENLLGMYLVN